MVMTVERPTWMPVERAPAVIAPPGATARALAGRYLDYVAALWRGDPGGRRFGIWLCRYWRAALPPAPASAPDAVSPHGGGGRGICWHETADAVLGYVPGVSGGYRIPKAALGEAPPLGSRAWSDGTRFREPRA
jgi:hypothetical protein